MRLISCDIENFGKLSDFHMDYQESINYIYGENGWGKSTLAAYIRVMFYGLENDGKRDRLERDRTRYQPWQGGVYGGRLTFAMGDRTYVIERSFGAKASEDVMVVRDCSTGLETGELGAVPGERVFGLDAMSFSNSVFVEAGCCRADITGGIKNRFGQKELEYQDLGLYDQAEAKLHDYLNRMSPGRATGRLNKDKKTLADMEYRLSYREHYENLVQQQSKAIEENKTRLEELKDERKKLGQDNRRLSGQVKKAAKAEGNKYEKASGPSEGLRLLLAVLCLGLWLAAGAVYYWREDIIITGSLATLGLICLIIRIAYSGKRSKQHNIESNYLNERIEVLTDEIEEGLEKQAGLSGDLKDSNRMLRELNELQTEYFKLKAEYEENLVAYADARITREVLEQARNNLMLKFTSPLKDSFVRNYNIMTGSGGDRVTLDVKGKVGWLEAGAQRDVRSLSTGYQDIVGLCTRMAYIETMYRQEKPFVILDDPFVHLDEKNKEGAERLLLELGRRYQVIYLTCSQGL